MRRRGYERARASEARAGAQKAKALDPLLYVMAELGEHGVEADDMLAALALGKRDAIVRVCEALLHSPSKPKERVMGFLLAKMVERCAAGGFALPEQLAALVAAQLKAKTFRPPAKWDAYERVIEHYAFHPTPSNRKAAVFAGISRTEVNDYVKRPGFQPLVEAARKQTDC